MSDLFSRVESLRRKSADREAERAKVKQQQAAENRARMPQIAAWVDEVKAVFPDAKVTYAKEGKYEFGEKLTGGIKLSETLVGPWNKPAKAKA